MKDRFRIYIYHDFNCFSKTTKQWSTNMSFGQCEEHFNMMLMYSE